MVQAILAPDTPLMRVGMDRFRWTDLDEYTQTRIKKRDAWEYKQKNILQKILHSTYKETQNTERG